MANAATEFFPQYNKFNQGMGSYVGSAAVELVKADVLAKEAGAKFLEGLLVLSDGKTPRPNVVVKDTFSFAKAGKDGENEEASFTISTPVFTLVDLTSFLPQTAEINMEMNVDSSAEDNKSYEAEEKAEGGASIGVGPFKAHLNISVTCC